MLSISSKTPSIYQIRHIESGKVYVGSTVNPRKRCCSHRNALIAHRHCASHLQYAWNKYGESAFVFEILEPVLFVEDLVSREQYWIDRLHATDSRYGFNTAPVAGSQLGSKHTLETRKKMAEARRGYRHSEETRQKIGNAHRGRKHSPDARLRMSAACKNRPPISDETRKKFSDSRKGRKRPASAPKVASSQRGKPRSAAVRQRMSDAHRKRLPPSEMEQQAPRKSRRKGVPKKLTQAQVDMIRSLYGSGEYTQQALADMFNVDRSLIGYIVRGVAWQQAAIPEALKRD